MDEKQTSSPVESTYVRKLSKIFRRDNLVEGVPILKRIKWPNNK